MAVIAIFVVNLKVLDLRPTGMQALPSPDTFNQSYNSVKPKHIPQSSPLILYTLKS